MRTEEITLSPHYASIITNSSGIDREFQPITRRNMVRADDYYKRLSGLFSDEREILPRNCRMTKILPDGGRVVVIEETPSVRSIYFDMGMESIIERFRSTGKIEEYGYKNFLRENVRPYRLYLSFPYVVLIMSFDPRYYLRGLKAFYRLHPITSPMDYLFRTNLLNTPDGQYMCLGGIRQNDDDPLPGTLVEACEQVVDKFWRGLYNADYSHNYKLYSNVPEVCDPLTWQYNTAKDPMFIFNVEWIAYHRSLIEDYEAVSSEMCSRDSSRSIGYDLFRSVFTKSIPTQKRKEQTNIATEAMMVTKILEVGDEIVLPDGKKCIVNEFYGTNSGRRKISGMKVCLQGESKVTKMRFDPALKKHINEQLYHKQVETFTLDGKTFQVKDILILKNEIAGTTLYKSIRKIRIARDGAFEVQLDGDWYLLENIEFDVFDKNNFTIQGIKVDTKKSYLAIHRGYRMNPLWRYYKGKFSELKTSGTSDSRMVARFKLDDTMGNIDIPLDKVDPGSKQLFTGSVDELTSPPVFRYFTHLITNQNYTTKHPSYLLEKGKGVLARSTSMDRYERELAEKHLLNRYGTALHIPSWDMDIDFKIGDPVVIADWENPANMLKVSVISGFTIENGKLWISADWIDGKGVYSKIPYVDLRRGRVDVGTIRHIAPKYKGWNAGDKVRAKESGIAAFPKKDVNTIIGFLIDTGTKYPLALFSNLCTLWMSPIIMKKFERFKRMSVRWAKHKVVSVNMLRLKPQPGDVLIKGTDSKGHKRLYFISVSASRGSTREFLVTLEKHGFDYIFNKDEADLREFTPYGFLNPRFSTTHRISQLTRKSSYPNFHGGYSVDKEGDGIWIGEEWQYVQCTY